MGNVGNKIKEFFVDTAKVIAKAGTSALGKMVPVIGEPLADKINSMYRKGGVAMKFDMGGVVPAGLQAKAINTPAQLIQIIKKFPDIAADHGLSVEAVKDAVSTKKKGGRASKFMDAHYESAYAHGGCISLPVSNLDRLNRYARGTPHYYPMDSSLAEPHSHGGHHPTGDSVVLHHGDVHHPRYHSRRHLA